MNPAALLTPPEGKAVEAAAVASPGSGGPIAQTQQQCQSLRIHGPGVLAAGNPIAFGNPKNRSDALHSLPC